jgi:hypothetical protein
MAAERGPLSEAEFISRMIAAGVREETAKFVLREASRYYFEPLKPDPDDRWEGTMRIDPEDLEDVTAKYWREQGWAEPTRKDPVMIPSDPTLLEFGQWLELQRQFQE